MHCVAGPAVSMVASSMRLPISLPSPVASPSMRLLHGVGTVDPLGGGGGELLRLLARGQRRPQLEPAQFVAHLADGPVDLAVDEVVDVAAPPFVGDQRLVVDVGEARLEAPARQRLDGGAEAVLVAGLAGLVLGARHGGGGAGGRHLREQEGSSGEAGNGRSDAVESCAHGLPDLASIPRCWREIWGCRHQMLKRDQTRKWGRFWGSNLNGA